MGDLIFIPTTRGSLKLQEDGGTDAISIAPSGVSTITNATISAGTINSAVNFPTGHILQTATDAGSGTGGGLSISTGSTSYVQVTDAEVSMTALQTNGKYILHFCTARGDGNNTATRGALTFYKSENTGAWSECGNPAINATHGHMTVHAGNYYGAHSTTYVYQATITAGQNIKFRPYFKFVSGGSTFYIVNQAGWMFMAQEIKV